MAQDIDNAIRIPQAKLLVFDDFGVSADVAHAVGESEKQGKIDCKWAIGVRKEDGCDLFGTF